MNMRESQEFFANPDKWPDESVNNLPPEWRMSYLSTKWAYTDFATLMQAIDENGKGEVFNDVLIQLGYKVVEEESGMKGIHTTRRDGGYAILRIARFLLDTENQDKSSDQLSSELRDLGYYESSEE